MQIIYNLISQPKRKRAAVYAVLVSLRREGMNKKIVSHIQYSWIAYVLIAAVVIIFWSVLFNAMSQPEDNEKISIIFYSEGWDSFSLSKHLQENKGDITAQPLKIVDVEQASVNKTILKSRIGTDMMSVDIMAIEQSLLDNSTESDITIRVEDCFYPLDTAKLEELFGDISVNYLTIDGKAYGFYLNDPDDGVKNRFEEFYTGDDTFLLFFSRNSVNLDRMNSLGNEGDLAAIDFVKYLLEIDE